MSKWACAHTCILPPQSAAYTPYRALLSNSSFVFSHNLVYGSGGGNFPPFWSKRKLQGPKIGTWNCFHLFQVSSTFLGPSYMCFHTPKSPKSILIKPFLMRARNTRTIRSVSSRDMQMQQDIQNFLDSIIQSQQPTLNPMLPSVSIKSRGIHASALYYQRLSISEDAPHEFTHAFVLRATRLKTMITHA